MFRLDRFRVVRDRNDPTRSACGSRSPGGPCGVAERTAGAMHTARAVALLCAVLPAPTAAVGQAGGHAPGVVAASPASAGQGRAQPELELRAAATFEAFPFSRVRGIHELPDRTVVVVDQTENAVWRVNLDAGTRTRVGAEGEGPEEFDGPTGVSGFRGDSVMVTDLGNGRLSVLGADLSFGRTMPMFVPTGGIPSMADAEGRLYHDLVSRTRLRKREDPSAQWAPVVRWDVDGERADTLTLLRVPGPPNPGPFPDWDIWAAGRDGRVAVVRNQDEYRVDWVLADGREIAGRTVSAERPRVTSADREAWHERNPAGMTSATLSRAGEPRRRVEPDFPDRFPHARQQGTSIDVSGRLWVERQQPLRESQPLYDVWVAERGRVARVRLPAGRRLVGFGRGVLYAVRVDDVDLQWLERYSIEDVATGAR